MRSHFLVGLGLGAFLLVLPACSSGYSDFCDKKISCEGGNDADKDACVAQAEGSEDVASAYDCNDAYDKLVDCAKSKSSCKEKDYGSGDACQSEQKALSECVKAASGKK